MRTRVGKGALAAGLVLGLWALAVACSDQSAKPETVLSGNVNGSISGVNGGYPDTGVSDDAGDDSGDGGETAIVSCTTAGSFVCISSDAAAAIPCDSPSTSSTTCPLTISSGPLLGCCAMPGGTIVSSCYYTGSTSSESTSTGCVAAGGAWSTTPPQ